MTNKAILINLLFGATFFNHLHFLKFIPQHNRPLLLVLLPVFIFFIHKYKSRFNFNLLLWFCSFFIIAKLSFVWNYIFGDYPIFISETLIRYFSYITIFYFVLIGIIFYQNKKLISDKFYYFFMVVGIIQFYSILKLPFSSYIINLFDNYLIDSFASPSNYILFFEAEPSYVAFLILFLMVFFEHKNSFIWVFFSGFTISVRTTVVSILYFIRKHYIKFGTIFILLFLFIFPRFFNSYSVYSRINAIFTLQQLDPSTYVRYVNNKIAGEIILDYALFGVGPGQYSTYYSHKYLPKYDTRNINELVGGLKMKTKTSDPYSFIMGLVSELGILIAIWIISTFYYFYFFTKRKYLMSVILMILLWGYPFGKPYIWILFGYLFEESKSLNG